MRVRVRRLTAGDGVGTGLGVAPWRGIGWAYASPPRDGQGGGEDRQLGQCGWPGEPELPGGGALEKTGEQGRR